MSIEHVRDSMFIRILQCEREGRQPAFFEAAPEFVTLLRSIARPDCNWVAIDAKNPERLTAFGVPVLTNIGWSIGWLLYDRNRRPVDDGISA